jgi:hypothetical protein
MSSTVRNSDSYFCYHCGADSSDFPNMTEAEMEEFDNNHLDANRPLVYEECCPFCGFPYEDEDDDWF